MSGSVDSSISESGMTENMGVEVGVAAPSITGQKLFQLPSGFCQPPSCILVVCHRLPTSVNLRQCPQCQVEVGRGRKCGGIRCNYVCMFLANRSYIDQQKIFDFSMEGALGFPGNGKSYVHAEKAKHPELDHLRIGFDRILQFARVAKIFEKT
jgi:hypothetical protein